MAPLSQNILEGKEQPSIVLVHDTVAQSGRGVLRSFIFHLTTKLDHVHVIATEGNPKKTCLQSEQRITIHDATSDPLGWNPASDGRSVSLDEDFTKYVQKALSNASGSQKIGLVIDNISNVIFRRGISAVCQMLHRLMHLSQGSSEISQVVGLVHADLHDGDTLALLNYSSTCNLKVEPPAHGDFHISCQTLHKRTSGKVVKSNDHIRFGKNWSLVSCEEIINIAKTATVVSDGSDPTANLTFNLSLTDKEKEDKNNVVLPYMKHSTKSITIGDEGGGGKIFYQPDDADDFDEEDPDDDLDI